MKAGKLTVETGSDTQHVRFAALLDNDGRYQEHAIAEPREQIAVLQYTGGTTGLPKGAMLTHGNLSAACQQYWATVDGIPPVLVEGQERVLAVLPPFHIYALSVNMLLGIRAAAELILHPRFDAEAVLKDISTKNATSFPGVPTMFTALLSHPDVAKYDLHSLKYCGSGGAPLPLEVAQRFQQVTGCPLSEGWGMTETSPTGTFTPVHGKRKAGSCGMPLPQIEIRMLDIGDPSRYVRARRTRRALHPRPERDEGLLEQARSDRRGDDLRRHACAPATSRIMDDDGFVFIVDRTKDMILCSGFNVYPRNLEDAIYQHPAVAEVIVIGIADEYRGQSPKAFVKLKPGAAPFTLAELQAFLKDKLGKHEMVQALDIRAELPKTPVGKLSKKELYEEEEQKRAAKT